MPILDEGEPERDGRPGERVPATAGISRAKSSKPRRWKVSAPFCLPRPIAIIFISPLSTGPEKSVWGLTRLTGTMRSASSKAWRSTNTGTPGSTSPRSDRVHGGADLAAHRLGGDAVAREDRELALGGRAAVAAHRGDDEDVGPGLRSRSTTARATSSMRSMPRLPAATQTRVPGRTVPMTSSSRRRTAAWTSSIARRVQALADERPAGEGGRAELGIGAAAHAWIMPRRGEDRAWRAGDGVEEPRAVLRSRSPAPTVSECRPRRPLHPAVGVEGAPVDGVRVVVTAVQETLHGGRHGRRSAHHRRDRRDGGPEPAGRPGPRGGPRRSWRPSVERRRRCWWSGP